MPFQVFLLIVIVIGGIVSGVFTATEGAGVCVLYCLLLSVLYRSITYKSFLKILVDSACVSGIILFLIQPLLQCLGLWLSQEFLVLLQMD